jgi:hypothetical protein
MPLGSLLIRCFRIVNHCGEPVAVLPEVENHISLNTGGIFERAANLGEIMPSNFFDYRHPCFDLVRGIWILLPGLIQVLAYADMHYAKKYFTICEVLKA